MRIPNDTGHPYRLNKFVEYQHKVPAIDPITIAAYADLHHLDDDERVWLAWLNSVTYCEITVPFLYEILRWRTVRLEFLERFWKTHKPTLIFNSARRYAKNMDWFVPLIHNFLEATERKPYAWLLRFVQGSGEENYGNVYRAATAFRYTGRFAAERFIVTLIPLMGHVPFMPQVEADWKKRSNTASGLLNVFYLDDEADEFDRSGKLAPGRSKWLDAKIVEVAEAIRREYPKQYISVPLIETKLCSFRNLFKGTRYGGYHHDRQLENLRAFESSYPNMELWKKLYHLRSKLFPSNLLGEKGGWSGIRKERKKLWLTTGNTGVEANV